MSKVYGSDPQKERLKIQKSINRLSAWVLKKYNVTVCFGSDLVNQFEPDLMEIHINTRTNLRARLHTLLHECGHVVIRSNRKLFLKHFADRVDDKYDKGYIIDILREEFLAWEKGLEIAKNLKIKIDTDWYKRHMQEPLWSYVEWAKAPKDWCI